MKLKVPQFQFTLTSFLNVIGVFIIAYLLVVLAGTIKRNYDLGNEAKRLQAQSALLQAQRDELAYNLQYYGTDSFREREARAKLGLQAPGEQVIIIQRPSPSAKPAPETSGKSASEGSNFSQWLKFLMGRG
jgi:cell division protein FtsB